MEGDANERRRMVEGGGRWWKARMWRSPRMNLEMLAAAGQNRGH